ELVRAVVRLRERRTPGGRRASWKLFGQGLALALVWWVALAPVDPGAARRMLQDDAHGDSAALRAMDWDRQLAAIGASPRDLGLATERLYLLSLLRRHSEAFVQAQQIVSRSHDDP